MAVCGAVYNHLQVCYDIIGRDAGGFTVRFYVNTIGWGWADDQVLQIRGSNGTAYDHGYRASASSGQTKELTRIDIGFPVGAGCANFSAVTADVAGGSGTRVDGSECGTCSPPNPPGVGAYDIAATAATLACHTAGAENGCTTDSINYRIHRTWDGAHMGDLQGGYSGVRFTNLAPGTTYDGYGQAHNAAGWGGFSAAARFTTLSTVPNAATVLVSDITATSAKLRVGTIPADNGSAIDHYLYRVFRVSDGANVGQVTGDYLGAVVPGLARATAYNAVVYAHNALGYGPESAKVRFDTLPSVPGAPTITGISSITPTSAVVSWSPPSDTGGQTITAYDVEYSTDDFATKVTQATGTLTGLTPGAIYKVRVRAKNASGPGPYSTPVTFVTQTGMKYWTGTAFQDAPVYWWDGDSFESGEVRIYNGTAWVPTG
jgi:hypothetical protein